MRGPGGLHHRCEVPPFAGNSERKAFKSAKSAIPALSRNHISQISLEISLFVRSVIMSRSSTECARYNGDRAVILPQTDDIPCIFPC